MIEPLQFAQADPHIAIFKQRQMSYVTKCIVFYIIVNTEVHRVLKKCFIFYKDYRERTFMPVNEFGCSATASLSTFAASWVFPSFHKI